MTEDKDLNVLKNFINPIKYCSKFHETIAVFLCVHFLPPEEENTLKTVFRYLDKDGKGIITKEIMKKSLEEIDIEISDEELQKIFDDIDENGSSFIEYQEFIRNTCDIKKLMSEANLKNIFNVICGDKEIMTGQDIKNFVFHDTIVREETLNEYFESFGMKFEESILFDEFFNMIKNNTKLGKKEKNEKNKKFEFKGDVIDEKEEEEENGGNIAYNEEVIENGSGKFKIIKTKENKKEN